jgi:hypothetical protein
MYIMDFFIWLMAVKKLRNSVSECKEAYSKLSSKEKDKLQDEYVTGGYDD